AKGMNVVAAARDSSRLDAALDALDAGMRQKIVGIAADVTKEADVTELVRQTVERLGRVDVVVNSAGVSMSARTRLIDSTSAEWHKIINTNLTGTYLMCRECL